MKQCFNISLLAIGLALIPASAMADGHMKGAYFISPQAQANLGTTVDIKMGIHGMKVRQAGELVAGTGHHHLIIDGGFVAKGEVVSKDAQHIHFGKGQTETSITLTPGKHTLTLQFADGFHQSYGEQASQTITVTVAE